MMRAVLELAIGTFLYRCRRKELSIRHGEYACLVCVWLKNGQFCLGLAGPGASPVGARVIHKLVHSYCVQGEQAGCGLDGRFAGDKSRTFSSLRLSSNSDQNMIKALGASKSLACKRVPQAYPQAGPQLLWAMFSVLRAKYARGSGPPVAVAMAPGGRHRGQSPGPHHWR